MCSSAVSCNRRSWSKRSHYIDIKYNWLRNQCVPRQCLATGALDQKEAITLILHIIDWGTNVFLGSVLQQTLLMKIIIYMPFDQEKNRKVHVLFMHSLYDSYPRHKDEVLCVRFCMNFPTVRNILYISCRWFCIFCFNWIWTWLIM